MTSIKYVVLALIVTGGLVAQSAEYYVETDGNDTASGSIETPFSTVANAASKMKAGDTCFIREGTYHEEVILSGKNKLTFRAYPGETVVMDGTKLISGEWIPHNRNIHKISLTEDVWQLFANGQMVMPARWPNATLKDRTVWDQKRHWARLVWNAEEKSIMQDAPTGYSDLAALPFSVSNAMAVLNVGSFKSYTRPVLDHATGSGAFTVSPVGNKKARPHQYYFLEGKLEFLDAPEEWHFNSSTKELYYWGDTNTVIRGKVQDYAFRVTNCNDITISGINFFATTVHFAGCDRVRIENGTFEYPSCTKRLLGVHSVAPLTTSFIGGSENIFFNNTMRFAESHAVYMNNGTDNTIENCLFEFIDWSSSDLPNLMGSIYMRGSGAIFRGNTVRTTGASECIDVNHALIAEMNLISDIGLVQNDGAMIQLTIGAQPNSVTAYNWFVDSIKYGARFDASTAPGSPTGREGLMHHNIGYKVSGAIMQKGDYHRCINNTAVDTGKGGIIILADHISSNAHSITRNNAADKLSSHRSKYVILPGDQGNNWNGYQNTGTLLNTLLRDPDQFDFRPCPDSALVDGGIQVEGLTDEYTGSAPDIGAYEHGAATYWIPGRKTVAASFPIPQNGSTAKVNSSLMWREGLGATSHDIYLGTSSNAVLSATPNDTEFAGNQSNNIHDPQAMPTQTCYWRIDEHTPNGIVKGAVWSFTVHPKQKDS